MRLHQLKAILKTAVSGAALLLLGVGSASAQTTVNITAGPANATLPDGSSVSMWGYSCNGGVSANCRPLNSAATSSSVWSPIVITTDSSSTLTINLTNGLTFGGNNIPTSLVIVGQLGGGLGAPTLKDGPIHDNQGTTWPIANGGPVFVPPAQGKRVQSFGTEVAAGATTELKWSGLKPGTYLLESGTHPSIQAAMGLVGMVVVTGSPYPTSNADVSLLFSEIDPVQNNAIQAAVNSAGFSETATRGVAVGGPVSSINLTNGGSGYNSAPTVKLITPQGSIEGHATAVIDTDPTSPTFKQVTEIDIVDGGSYTIAPQITISGGGGSGASATAALQLQANGTSVCNGLTTTGDPAQACYPSVVNYTPLYYLINGVAFDKTNASASVVAASNGTAANPISGTVLVRMVNAGSRMHVPSIVGSTTKSGAAQGFSLVAEDGNLIPGTPRVQNEVFMAAGKTYDLMIDVPVSGSNALPVFDRELSLSANSISRDAGMLAYIGVNGSDLPATIKSGASGTGAVANPDEYDAVISGKAPAVALTISDPAKGVMGNDLNIMGVRATVQPSHGALTLNADGTFSYTPDGSWPTTPSTSFSDTFTYCGNGAMAGSAACATVTLKASNVSDAGITLCPAPTNCTYASNVATSFALKAPGLLDGATDTTSNGDLPLTVVPGTFTSGAISVTVNQDGSLSAKGTAGGSITFTFTAANSLGAQKTHPATITFPQPSGLKVTVVDGADKTIQLSSYRWIIEEDRTFFSDPKCTTNPPPAGCPGDTAGIVPNFGTNFHTSFMPVIATGCTDDLSCGNTGQSIGGNSDLWQKKPLSSPSDVALCPVPQTTPPTTNCLDPNKRYYISVLPGDAAQPFLGGSGSAPTDCALNSNADPTQWTTNCGHGMGGAPIAKGTHDGNQSITVVTEPSPYPPATLSVFVFEDDYPLNGEHDAGGGIDSLSPNEPGLGGFQITLQDDAGGTGDATGTPTYDMFNMPLSNSLAGTIDPVTKQDACPITAQGGGITGMIITCPKYEADGTTLSPLAGQAIVRNLYQGRYGVVANPGADRIARGEEWVQTNTLDGQKAHDSFMRIGEPAYFQEFGPAGYHVTIGFANPKIIQARHDTRCAVSGSDCTHEVKGHITTARMSRTPDERLYGSGTHDSYAFTQCYVSLGDPDADEFMFTKCDADGNFDFPNVPAGNWKITTFDQWNDQVVDGITTPVGMCAPQSSISPNPVTNCAHLVDMGEVAVHQWQSNIYTRTFIDTDYSGVSSDAKPGLALVDTNIRFRDGSFSNFNNTDLDGYAGFNEVFPLFNWYVIETDSTRYKNSGTHVVYDAGGPTDNPTDLTKPHGVVCSAGGSATKKCEQTGIAANLANTYEPNPLPADLSLPGSVYCDTTATADCNNLSIADGPVQSQPAGATSSNMSTGRIDAAWVDSYGWQGYSGQNNFLEFGKRPFADGENGGIHGHVVYASTRPFDDPTLLLQLSWEPLVPHVRVNLYKEGLASDGVTKTLTLVDHTETTSFDDWAQGFRTDKNGNPIQNTDGTFIPNMNCPGQGTDTGEINDPYYWFALKNQPEYLDLYTNGATTKKIAHDSQFKCYDGMHNWNQLQPAPYDGMYSFPSVTAIDPVTGRPSKTNCTGCISNPTSADTKLKRIDPKFDPYRAGTPMLPDGKYVVEVVVPDGYELVKEEDKNILIGDNFIAPVTQQFGGLGSIFILPDQAAIEAAFNANNGQNSTTDLGRSILPSHEADTGSVETFWPCVGAERVVPDFISLFPGSQEVAPFAGATRPLCDRKEVTLDDQTSALVKFYIFTETHKAAHFTGVITDDFTAEFDPFSPQFGEKFGPAYLPVSFKDWAGNEIDRVYTDAWGAYNGLSYSTWEVNPPNPTGYGPTMMVGCMNDAGPVNGKTDPLFQDGYSQFCYELPFMPGQTGYFDTPVVPTAAFAGGYNNPDCAYPDNTPAISEVDGDVTGPWVSAAGHPLTIKALGSQQVDNYQYSGPGANAAPYNQQKATRNYHFGPEPTTFTQFKAPSAGQFYSCGSGTGTGTPVCPYVTIDGQPMSSVVWGDLTITGNVPSGVSQCKVQQQLQYAQKPDPAKYFGTALCGELQITAANGNQSVDTVTITIGGKTPTLVSPGAGISASGLGVLQKAIDAALPGDMLIVQPGTYSEMLLMWKPVRLQGVGAASSIIDGNPHPAGKLDPWRQRVVCLFGLALDGTPISSTHPYDPTNQVPCAANMNFSVDRLPLEATVGWDATLNGNLAEQLIEPTLMGAYEGAGITVLGKGVKFPTPNPNDPTSLPFASDVFPTGTVLLDNSTASLRSHPNGCGPNTSTAVNPFPSNFYCNPSSIDGLTIQNSSQGGGAIWDHAWGHELQIANNRIINNQGTMSGGITIGQGEHPDAFLAGQSATNTVPGSCISDNGVTTNMTLPYCNDVDVNVHHNYIAQNSSLGDELFSSTPAGAGGVTFCNGSDYYKFDYNWVCGNMSTGDGAGVAHVGFTYDGEIQHNAILYNQTTNPTIVTNGGGLLIMGAPDADPPCGLTTDQDCVSAPGDISPSDGTGPGLVINANLLLGNSADSGSGGGLRLQHINGTEVLNFPNANFNNPNRTNNWPRIANHDFQPDFQLRTRWNAVQVTNNIIANNVAGIDGGGVSLLDALAVDFINNTVISNNSTASSGVLLQTLFAPLASTGPGGFQANCGGQSCPQVAGLVSVQNSEVLAANMQPLMGSIVCPTNHGTKSSTSDCTKYSVPVLYNDLFWANRSLIIGVADPKAGYTNQQNTVGVINPAIISGATQSNAGNQAHTGDCDPNASFWDIGIRGDKAPGSPDSGGKLQPMYSFLTNPNGTTPLETGNGSNNRAGNPLITASYCNGSRVPPEAAAHMASSISPYPGWEAPPGTNESNALPAPPFTLMPAATVDEGNNWINLRWGPLSLYLPNGTKLLDASLGAGSQAIDETPVMSTNTFNPYSAAPSIDYNGSPRKIGTDPAVDAGAIEAAPQAPTYTISVNPASLNFGTILNGTNTTLTVTVTNTGNQQLTGGTFTVTGAQFSRNGGNCGGTLNSGANCTIGVRFTAPSTGTVNSFTGNLQVAYNNGVSVAVPLSGSRAALVVTPASLDFGNVGVTNPASASAPLSLTLRNASGGTRTITGITFTGPFSRATAAQGGAGSCGTTLGNGNNCTINVVFTPPAVQATPYSGQVAITVNGGFTVGNSPVTLAGTGVTPTTGATLTPTTWTPTQTRNCPGTGLGILACLFDPAQAFTLTNTGNVAITGIARGSLTGANVADFAIVNALSSCGPAGGGQPTGNVVLGAGASCVVTVQFKPLTAEAAGTKNVTVNVTDSLGTQSVNIVGNAN